MKTQFSFRSIIFNCTEPRDYFINDGCFGDDVANWLIEKLQAQGLDTLAEPEQEDFGWYFTFHAGGVEHCVVISFQPIDRTSGDRWLGWVERQTGFVGSIFGGRTRGILHEAVQAIDQALSSSPDIQDISWYETGTSYDRLSSDERVRRK